MPVDSELLMRLREPDCYPGAVEAVEIRQTHLSVVALAGDFAYKLKKPVHFPFVDFSTRERREHFCREELRLNRRLCPDIYLEVMPLYRIASGSWSFREEAGEVVDYAVKMVRLPESLLMDVAMAENRVDDEQVRELGRIMARFHRRAKVSSSIGARSCEQLRHAVLANFSSLKEDLGEDSGYSLREAIRERALRDLRRWGRLMQERAERGCVVDGHGDLHARNICLTDPPAIFDCIEFEPEFRLGDVAVENGFLMMDLVYRGRPDLARSYLDSYVEESGDAEQIQLLPLCLSYRAMVRAKVAALSRDDSDLPDAEREHADLSMRRHQQLAASSALNGDHLLLLTCGLPATGKSYLARALSERSGWSVVSSDRIRKELAGYEMHARLPEKYYDPHFSRQTYQEVIQRAVSLLRDGCVLVDANFPTAEWRQRAAEVAREIGARPVVLWTSVPEATVAERMGIRGGDPDAESDADWAVYQKLRTRFETPDSSEGIPIVPLDGAEGVDPNLDRVLTELLVLGSAAR